LQVSAERPFISKDESRTLKLGETYKWAVGFYDQKSVGAFSRDMDLILDNSYDPNALKPTKPGREGKKPTE
jgi:hypothetical protein